MVRFLLDALVRLLHTSGARIAEVLALDLDELDFHHRKFQVVGKGNKQRWCFYSEATQSHLDRDLAELMYGFNFLDDLKAYIHRTFDLVKITFSYLDD